MEQLALIDANASIGCGARSRSGFETPESLLAHMDRFGIERAVTWHVAARDLSPAWGNRRLAHDLAASDAAQGRLIPAYTIAPTMLYQPGAIAGLAEALSSGAVRALRAFPGTLRHTPAQLESVLCQVAALKPVLFVDVRDVPNLQDLVPLLLSLPELPVVLTQAMWTELVTVFDLMRRCHNVIVETSWLHTPETIELLVEEFGPERVLFGMGPRAHNGASIAALAYADLAEPDRALIAHGNIQRLLGLREPGFGARTGSGAASEWRQRWYGFLNGSPVGTDIVDAHGHVGPLGMSLRRYREIGDDIAYLVQCMDRLGIQTTIVSGMHALFSDPVEGNAALEASAGAYGERVRGYVTFSPHYSHELAPRLDDYFAGDFYVGFKLLCSYWRVSVTDPRFRPVWEYAEAHRLPVLLHTWDEPYDSPAMLEEIVEAYPHAAFLLGHSGGGDLGRQEAEELATAHNNIYLEFCGSFTSEILWEDTIARVGSSRVVFGTDQTTHNPAWELGRLLSLDMDWGILRRVLGENMRSILGARI